MLSEILMSTTTGNACVPSFCTVPTHDDKLSSNACNPVYALRASKSARRSLNIVESSHQWMQTSLDEFVTIERDLISRMGGREGETCVPEGGSGFRGNEKNWCAIDPFYLPPPPPPPLPHLSLTLSARGRDLALEQGRAANVGDASPSFGIFPWVEATNSRFNISTSDFNDRKVVW